MDLTIYSSHIFTGDAKLPWAEAVAVRNGLIQAIGSNKDVKRASNPGSIEIDLPGRLITPGFVDSHCHFISFGFSLQNIDLRNLSSIDACLKKIKETVSSRKRGEWIIGRNWNQNLWDENREPNREDLDKIAPENPVMMARVCTHSIWVNTMALEIAGITAETPDPPGGKIDKNPVSGKPTGIIREAKYLIDDHVPSTSLEERKQAAMFAQKEAFRMGLTGVNTMESLDEWEAFRSLEKEEKLKIRIYHTLPPDELKTAGERNIKPGGGSEYLWTGHAKMFADGALGSRTALLHDPYEDEPGYTGLPFLSPEELLDNVRLAYHEGWNVAIHAIGDKALTNALNAISSARDELPGKRPDRIEHVQLYRPKDLDLFHNLGVVASVQPVFVPTDIPIATKLLGTDRCRYAYAWKSLLETGIPLQFGSDAPVEPNDPVLGLQAAVIRKNPEGEPTGGWFPEQNLTLAESIPPYTLQPYISSGRSDILGTIAPGKRADMTVFSQNLFELSPELWTSVETEMTIVQGEIVYQK